MAETIGGYEVHPLAAIFPMMTDAELAELAADIKANGQQIPIVLEAAGEKLIDGRNRLAACRLAGVAPRFERLAEGQDAGAFILSVNVARRHLDKGQQAMATALVYPEAKHGGPRQAGSSFATKLDGISASALSKARTVLRDRDEQRRRAEKKGGAAPVDNVAGIMTGAVRLDGAYAEAVDREQAERHRADRLIELRKKAPDLAAQVDADELGLASAEGMLRERLELARQQRQTAFKDLLAVVRQLDGFAKTPRLSMADWLDDEKVETEFRAYFPGGVAELLDLAASVGEGFEALRTIIVEFTQRSAK